MTDAMPLVGLFGDGIVVGPCPAGNHYAQVNAATHRVVTHPSAPMLRDVCPGSDRYTRRDGAPPAHLIKIDPGRDLYVVWGHYTDLPDRMVDRRDAVDLWGGKEDWVQTADTDGSTSAFWVWGREFYQSGTRMLARKHLEEYSRAWLDGRKDEAEALLGSVGTAGGKVEGGV